MQILPVLEVVQAGGGHFGHFWEMFQLNVTIFVNKLWMFSMSELSNNCDQLKLWKGGCLVQMTLIMHDYICEWMRVDNDHDPRCWSRLKRSIAS